MKRPKVIAVCGLSGVGKTRLINQAVAKDERMTRLSAGAIIAEARHTADLEFLRQLSSNELDRSQELLIAGFPFAIASSKNEMVLLDAHTIIDNGGDELFFVSDAVFAALNPSAIVHVEAEPSLIASQREADSARERPHRSVQILNNHQLASAKRAEGLAIALGIPFARVRSGDMQGFTKLLHQVLGVIES